jgi:nitroreductase
MLRRNIHRLEKGLTMYPRNPIFAVSYIGETIRVYRDLLVISDVDFETIHWAHDVLEEYFLVVNDTAEIAQARTAFYSNPPPARPNGMPASPNRWVPMRQDRLIKSGVTFEDFLRLCQQRRSIRWFQAKPVSMHLIESAMTAALQAPSACNRQPFFFRTFTNASDASSIAALAMGTTGYHHQIPVLVAIIGDWSCFEHERDRHVPYIDAALAAMQFMLALETLGLSSCPINWPDVETLEAKMSARLTLLPYERPIMLIAVGYADPAGEVAFSAKKTVSTVSRNPS